MDAVLGCQQDPTRARPVATAFNVISQLCTAPRAGHDSEVKRCCTT